jgi:hypothetical protein
MQRGADRGVVGFLSKLFEEDYLIHYCRWHFRTPRSSGGRTHPPRVRSPLTLEITWRRETSTRIRGGNGQTFKALARAMSGFVEDGVAARRRQVSFRNK